MVKISWSSLISQPPCLSCDPISGSLILPFVQKQNFSSIRSELSRKSSPKFNLISFCPTTQQDSRSLGTADVNRESVSQVSQCTKMGDNGEIITVSITTEESHQASMLGNYSSLSRAPFLNLWKALNKNHNNRHENSVKARFSLHNKRKSRPWWIPCRSQVEDDQDCRWRSSEFARDLRHFHL